METFAVDLTSTQLNSISEKLALLFVWFKTCVLQSLEEFLYILQMLFICFACDDHVIEDTLGVRYSSQNLVYGTLRDGCARGDAKNQPIVLEKAFVRVNCEVLLRLLRHFHLVISLTQIKFAKMLSPSQINKNILYAR